MSPRGDPRTNVHQFIKNPEDLLCINAPHHAKFRRARPNNVGLREKHYRFVYTLQYFGTPKDPLGHKFTRLGPGVQ